MGVSHLSLIKSHKIVRYGSGDECMVVEKVPSDHFDLVSKEKMLARAELSKVYDLTKDFPPFKVAKSVDVSILKSELDAKTIKSISNKSFWRGSGLTGEIRDGFMGVGLVWLPWGSYLQKFILESMGVPYLVRCKASKDSIKVILYYL